MLVVDEICSGIILNSQNKESELKILWRDENAFVEVEIRDSDQPFNPLVPPEDEKECPELGAMGAYLIEKMVDMASYKRVDGHNSVLIKKNKRNSKKNHARS